MNNEISPFSPLPWTSGERPYHLIAGPCSAESEAQTMRIAQALKEQGVGIYRASLWKPRTKPGGFEGVGLEGMSWLVRVQNELGMQTMTEVATPAHIEVALRAGLKGIWIGARTTASPFAMTEIAEALKGVEDVIVLVKNPISPDINLWEGSLLRLKQAGVKHVGAIHRGFTTYGEQFYRNSPLWQIPIELKLRHPELTVLVDPSHIGGKRSLIEGISRSAIEMHFDGLMVEVHDQPDTALSDAEQQITPERLKSIAESLASMCTDNIDSPELSQYRNTINHIDEEILRLLVQRGEIAKTIGQYKHNRGMCILQPERYRELMSSREQQAQTLGLDTKYVHDLFSIIHEESVRSQQALLNNAPTRHEDEQSAYISRK